jgi:hypothetical protein
MKAKKEFRILKSLVLTDEEVKRIVKHFSKTDYFVFKAICVDKTVREFNTATELINYENTQTKEIDSLGINVFTKSHDQKAFIYLSRADYNNILVRFEGEEDEIREHEEFLWERFSAMSPWYWFLAGAQLKGLFIKLVITWIFAIPIGRFLWHLLINKVGVTPIINWIAYLALILAVGFLVNFLLDKIRLAYFPTAVFAIGQGEKRYKDKEIIRTVVIAGFFVSLITSIVFLLLYK